MNHHIHYQVYATHSLIFDSRFCLLDLLSPFCSAYVQVTIILLNNGPKHKSGDAGNLDKPKRNTSVFLKCKGRKYNMILREITFTYI